MMSVLYVQCVFQRLDSSDSESEHDNELTEKYATLTAVQRPLKKGYCTKQGMFVSDAVINFHH